MRTKEQKEKRNAYEKQRRKELPELYHAADAYKFARRYATIRGRAIWILQGIRGRCRRGNIPFDLTVRWICKQLINGKCARTGIIFDWAKPTEEIHRRWWARPFAPSIDRIDPNGGYTKDNCEVVVWIYNRAKADFILSDFEKMCKGYLEKLSQTKE